MSGDTAATVAIITGLAISLAAVFMGVLGSMPGAKQSGRAWFLTGFVIISLVATVAVLAGAYALHSHRRIGSGGRGRATTGMLAALIWTSMVGLVLFTPDPAQRDENTGEVIVAGSALLSELVTGDCLVEVPPPSYEDPTAATMVVPCDEPHGVHVVAAFDLPSDGTDAAAACARAANLEPEDVGGLHTVAPTQDVQDAYDVRQLVCLQA